MDKAKNDYKKSTPKITWRVLRTVLFKILVLPIILMPLIGIFKFKGIGGFFSAMILSLALISMGKGFRMLLQAQYTIPKIYVKENIINFFPSGMVYEVYDTTEYSIYNFNNWYYIVSLHLPKLPIGVIISEKTARDILNERYTVRDIIKHKIAVLSFDEESIRKITELAKDNTIKPSQPMTNIEFEKEAEKKKAEKIYNNKIGTTCMIGFLSSLAICFIAEIIGVLLLVATFIFGTVHIIRLCKKNHVPINKLFILYLLLGFDKKITAFTILSLVCIVMAILDKFK